MGKRNKFLLAAFFSVFTVTYACSSRDEGAAKKPAATNKAPTVVGDPSLADGTAAAPLVHGFDMDGKAKSCRPMQGEIACTAIFGKGDAFGAACKAAGATETACGCHEYICSKALSIVDPTNPIDPWTLSKGNIPGSGQTPGQVPQSTVYAGYNSAGVYAQCTKPAAGIICDMSFGPGDQYGSDCQKAGFQAFQCGCHDYLCSAKFK